MLTAILCPRVVLDEFIIMPNHIHGIIVLADDHIGRGTLQRALTVEQFGKPTSDSFPTIVWLFKSATAKRINETRGTPGSPIWLRKQRRDEAEQVVAGFSLDDTA